MNAIVIILQVVYGLIILHLKYGNYLKGKIMFFPEYLTENYKLQFRELIKIRRTINVRKLIVSGDCHNNFSKSKTSSLFSLTITQLN